MPKSTARACLPPQPHSLKANLMTEAVACHGRGDLARAEELYRKILLLDSKDIHALHLVGFAMTQTKRHESGIEMIDRALALKPTYFEALNTRGIALGALGRHEEALASYDKALAIRPDFADALVNRGNALNVLQRFEAALASYDRALKWKPGQAEAWNNRGVALKATGRLAEALASFEKALAIRPDYLDAAMNCGNTLNALERFEAALAAYDRAVAIKPGHTEAWSARSISLNELGRFAEALASCAKALAIAPRHAPAWSNCAVTLNHLRRYADALPSYDTALSLNPDHADTWSNRAVTLTHLLRFDEALSSFDRALALQPDNLGAWSNRGETLKAIGCYAQALASYDRALALKPDFADARFNRSLTALLMQDFETGWRDYETRWAVMKPLPPGRALPFPAWRGEDLGTKKIIVYEEQGHGDIMQFCRYLPLLEARGAEVMFYVRPSLVALMRDSRVAARVQASVPAGETFDYQAALMSLPLGFATRADSIPADTPYLRADPERVRQWRERLGEGGFKVGIAWEGSEKGKALGRSFALQEFAGLSQIPGVRLISLQKGGAEPLGEGVSVETLGETFDAGSDAFLDTAAVMQTLDLVISADTSIAHLAGALARPVWVAQTFVPDWRWMCDRADSPWYPSLRQFRQRTHNDWRSVFGEMEEALRGLLGAA